MHFASFLKASRSLLSPTPGSKNTEQPLLPTEPPVHLHPAQHGHPKTLWCLTCEAGPWEILSILGMVLDETFWKLKGNKGNKVTVFQSKNQKQHQNQTQPCSNDSNTYRNPFSFSTSPVILRDLTQVVVGILNLLDQTLAQLASAANASNPFGNLTSTGIGSITAQRHGFRHRSIAHGLLAMLGLKGQRDINPLLDKDQNWSLIISVRFHEMVSFI